MSEVVVTIAYADETAAQPESVPATGSASWDVYVRVVESKTAMIKAFAATRSGGDFRSLSGATARGGRPEGEIQFLVTVAVIALIAAEIVRSFAQSTAVGS